MCFWLRSWCTYLCGILLCKLKYIIEEYLPWTDMEVSSVLTPWHQQRSAHSWDSIVRKGLFGKAAVYLVRLQWGSTVWCLNGFLLPFAVLDSCLGRVLFFFSSGQGSTLSRKAALSYFGQLLLHIDSFHTLTVTGLRRTGLDNSCSKVLDSNSIYSLNVLIIRLNVYICVIKKRGGLFFFFFFF